MLTDGTNVMLTGVEGLIIKTVGVTDVGSISLSKDAGETLLGIDLSSWYNWQLHHRRFAATVDNGMLLAGGKGKNTITGGDGADAIVGGAPMTFCLVAKATTASPLVLATTP